MINSQKSSESNYESYDQNTRETNFNINENECFSGEVVYHVVPIDMYMRNVTGKFQIHVKAKKYGYKNYAATVVHMTVNTSN